MREEKHEGEYYGGIPVARIEELLVRAVRKRFSDCADTPCTLDALANEFDVSPLFLLHAFVRQVGLSPDAYLERKRIRLAMHVLKRGDSVSKACVQAGFDDPTQFKRVFEQWTGIPPNVYQALVA